MAHPVVSRRALKSEKTKLLLEETMEPITDWLLLWRQIVEEHEKSHKDSSLRKRDVWKDRAARFDENVKKRWARPDSSRSFVLEKLKANPGATVLDIGAGTGAWTCIMAPDAGRVIAVEPSESMASILERNIRDLGLINVDIIREKWPEADPGLCDFSLCSHAMYGYPDFRRFISRMEEVTEKTCFLLMKMPVIDGVMAEAAMRVWGHPYDSPNFQIAYNALMQMGLCPNVLMEDAGERAPWTHESIDEALVDVKRRLGLSEDDSHDRFLHSLLERRLELTGGRYVWPKGVRTALVYWDTEQTPA
jgi:SAM-dependent methyltransferase